MPRKELQPSPEQSPKITMGQIAAVFREPGRWGKTYYFGWTDTGLPAMGTSEEVQISELAQMHQQFGEPIRYAFKTEFGQDVPVVPVEFVKTAPPFDKMDTSQGFSQDVLQYAVTDSNGNLIYAYANELDVLDAITKYTVTWEFVNRQTILREDTIPAIKAFSLFMPVVIDNKPQIAYFLFPAPREYESNEYQFQQFLIQTMQAFVSLDIKQQQQARKGYEEVVSINLGEQNDSDGGFFYNVLDGLRGLGLYENSDEGMSALQIEMGKASVLEQIDMLGRELFFPGDASNVKQVHRQGLERFNTSQLIDLFKVTREYVRSRFSGRR